MSAKLHTYTSEQVTVTYDAKRCIHAAECVRGLPNVFDTKRRPWVLPAESEPDSVVDVVARCPSGALHTERHDAGTPEAAPQQNTLTLNQDGPLYLQGQIHIVNEAGETLITETRVALCRCGESNNKPFCDNAHREHFKHDGTFGPDVASDDSTPTDGPLTITPTTDGPYKVEGGLTIQDTHGATLRKKITWLCRCGASENKPFCDGSHHTIGFQADSSS